MAGQMVSMPSGEQMHRVETTAPLVLPFRDPVLCMSSEAASVPFPTVRCLDLVTGVGSFKEVGDALNNSCGLSPYASCLRWMLDSTLLQHEPCLVLTALSILEPPPPQKIPTDYNGSVAK